MRHPVVAIVGAGVSGLSTAMHLAKLGFEEITVVEQGGVGGGSSGLSVGNATTLYDERLDVEMRVQSLQFLREIQDEIGFKWTGNIRMTTDDQNALALERNVELQSEYGIRAQLVLPEDLKVLVPDMACDDIVAGIYSKDAGQIDGHLLCNAYLKRAQAGGATLRTQTRVLGLDAGTRCRYLLSTSTGGVQCDVVVNAAGAWAQKVGEILGGPVQIIAQRHEVFEVRLQRALSYVLPQVGESYTKRNATTGSGLYFQQERASSLIAGFHTGLVPGSPSVDPDDYSTIATGADLEELAGALYNRLPGFGDAGLKPGWAGLYPMSPDERPQIGHIPRTEGLVAACGVGGFGLHVSPVVGRLAAECVLWGEPRSLPQAAELWPGRFAKDSE